MRMILYSHLVNSNNPPIYSSDSNSNRELHKGFHMVNGSSDDEPRIKTLPKENSSHKNTPTFVAHLKMPLAQCIFTLNF